MAFYIPRLSRKLPLWSCPTLIQAGAVPAVALRLPVNHGGILTCMRRANTRLLHCSALPKGLERDKNTQNVPVGGENLYRRVGGPGYPMLFEVKYDRPSWQPLWEDEHEVIPRDGYGWVVVGRRVM